MGMEWDWKRKWNGIEKETETETNLEIDDEMINGF
jgi:hypothetical protein